MAEGPSWAYQICKLPPPRPGPVARNSKSTVHSGEDNVLSAHNEALRFPGYGGVRTIRSERICACCGTPSTCHPGIPRRFGDILANCPKLKPCSRLSAVAAAARSSTLRTAVGVTQDRRISQSALTLSPCLVCRAEVQIALDDRDSAQSQDDGDDAVSDIPGDGSGSRRNVDGMLDCQTVEGYSMFDCNVRDVHQLITRS